MISYIDMGLPSRTFWAESNEEGFYTFNDAVEKYGSNLPTREQLEELMKQCKWEWNGSGYNVTGPNGNSITLPAEGLRDCVGYVDYVGSVGCYWSSSPLEKNPSRAWHLSFGSGSVETYNYHRHNGFSIRLIENSVTFNGMEE